MQTLGLSMIEGWTETTLGQVADYHNGYPFKPSDLTGRGLPVVRIKQLLDPRAVVDLSDVAVAARHHVGDGDLLFSWSGTLASRIWSRGPALLNQHLFRVVERPGVERGWLQLALDHAVGGLTEKSHGTTMKHVTKKVLESHPVLLPPVLVQRRIVNIIGALDAQISALGEEWRSLLLALERAALRVLIALDVPSPDSQPLSTVFSRNVGGLWGEASGTAEMEVAVFRSTEFSDFGYLIGPADAQRSVAYRHFQSRALSVGDILVEKSGGTPTRAVGRVVRVAENDLVGDAIGANFLQLLRVDPDRACPDFTFWLLWATHRRGDAVNYQQASTNIRNLRTQDYLSRACTLPPLVEQMRIADALDATLSLLRCIEAEQKALSAVRARLLDALVSGRIDIPEAYDFLLAQAA